MTERPALGALLAEAQRNLMQELLPGLDEPQRFQARMIASVLGIAAREIEAGHASWDRLEAALRARLGQPEAGLDSLLPSLATAIRAGELDGDPALHGALREHIHARLAVANPKALPQD